VKGGWLDSLAGGTVKVSEITSLVGGTVKLAGGTVGGGFLDSISGATVKGGWLDSLTSATVKLSGGYLDSLTSATVKATVQGGWLESITSATFAINQVSTPYSTSLYISGDATIWTPSAGKTPRVKYIQFANYGATTTKVGLKMATAGGVSAATVYFRSALASAGGQINMNLIGCNWLGYPDHSIYANISATSDVSITLMVDEV
jgi:hypothetical protein